LSSRREPITRIPPKTRAAAASKAQPASSAPVKGRDSRAVVVVISVPRTESVDVELPAIVVAAPGAVVETPVGFTMFGTFVVVGCVVVVTSESGVVSSELDVVGFEVVV
jgi:hypothetical protein